MAGFFQFGEKRHLIKSDILLFCHDINRNYTYRGMKYSSIVDTLNELYLAKGLTTLTIARPFSVIPPATCFGKVCWVNGLIARAFFLEYLIRRCERVLSFSFSINAGHFRIIAWSRILQKVRPGLIIGIEPIKELCAAAKQNNICVIDLQHGANIDTTGTQAGHFYRIAYREPYQQGWPDFVACWDEISSKLLTTHRAKFTTPIVIGHPWMARFLSPDAKDDPLIQELSRKFPLKSDCPVVLYSLNYTRDADGNSDSFSPIPEQLDRYIKNEGRRFSWWIRIHPQLLRVPHRDVTLKAMEELYSEYNNANWIEASLAPLPYLLEKIVLHLTRASSVTKEAAMFGVKTGLLDEADKYEDLNNVYNHEIQSGFAKILEINNYAQIKDFIESSVYQVEKNEEDGANQVHNLKNFINVTSNSISKRHGVKDDLLKLNSINNIKPY